MQKRYTYITQYRETDFNFVQRLLEEEGMFYYFEHTAEGHTMIICDDSSMLQPLPEQPQIRFHTASVTETADSITKWSGKRQLQAGKMAVQTFDYRQPNNRLPVGMNSLNKQRDVETFEIYDFPGQYTHGTYDEGETLLRLRMEALEIRGKKFEGASNCRAMKPGYTFELVQHYDHDQRSADDRQFLLMGVESAVPRSGAGVPIAQFNLRRPPSTPNNPLQTLMPLHNQPPDQLLKFLLRPSLPHLKPSTPSHHTPFDQLRNLIHPNLCPIPIHRQRRFLKHISQRPNPIIKLDQPLPQHRTVRKRQPPDRTHPQIPRLTLKTTFHNRRMPVRDPAKVPQHLPRLIRTARQTRAVLN